jgi:hypothetical protein
MNFDALDYFESRFYPIILQKAERPIKVVVAGSSPSQSVRQLCRRNRWELHADVSEDALSALYGRACFSILPFPYTNGAKLKLLYSISRGVPVLSTCNLSSQLVDSSEVFPSLFSDSPEQWAMHLNQYGFSRRYQENTERLLTYAGKYSWESVTRDFVENVEEMVSQVSAHHPTTGPH